MPQSDHPTSGLPRSTDASDGATSLTAAIAREAGALESRHPRIAFRLEVSGGERALRPATDSALADIAREALRNAFVHSGSRTVEVVIDYSDMRLALQVRDKGAGIAEAALAQARQNQGGLSGMGRLADGIGARLDLYTRPGAGATVSVVVPAEHAYRG